MILTDHAVERFCERIQPGTSFLAARVRIEAHLTEAILLPEKTRAQYDIYLIEALACRLVVRPARWDGDQPALITVLPIGDAVEEALVPADPLPFDPAVVAAQIQACKSDEVLRTIIEELAYEQVLTLKRWAAVRVPKAHAGRNRAFTTMLHKVGACCNARLATPEAGRALRHLFLRSAGDEGDLLRVLGEMLKKYGAAQNPAAAEVYERVSAAVRASQNANAVE